MKRKKPYRVVKKRNGGYAVGNRLYGWKCYADDAAEELNENLRKQKNDNSTSISGEKMRKYKGNAKCSCGKRAKYKVENDGHPKFRCEAHKDNISHLPDWDEPEDDTLVSEMTYKRLK